MKNEVIDEIYSISTNEGGIYSALFGFEGFKKAREIHISLASKIENDEDLTSTVKLFLDMLLAKLVEAMSFIKEDDDVPGIYYNREGNIGATTPKYSNVFLSKSVYVNTISICDLETFINDIRVARLGEYTTIELTLPVYVD